MIQQSAKFEKYHNNTYIAVDNNST